MKKILHCLILTICINFLLSYVTLFAQTNKVNPKDSKKLPLSSETELGDSAVLNLKANKFDFLLEESKNEHSGSMEKIDLIEFIEKLKGLLYCATTETLSDKDNNIITKKYERCKNATFIPVASGKGYAYTYRTQDFVVGEIRIIKKNWNKDIGEKGDGEEVYVFYTRNEDVVFDIVVSKSIGIEKYWDSQRDKYAFRTWASRPFFENISIDNDANTFSISWNGFSGWNIVKLVEEIQAVKDQNESKKALKSTPPPTNKK